VERHREGSEVSCPQCPQGSRVGSGTRARNLARAVGAKDLELYGSLIINPDIEQMLLRQGYVRARAPLPEELGGGVARVLRKVSPVKQ